MLHVRLVYAGSDRAAIDYRIVLVVSPTLLCRSECATPSWDAAAGGLTMGWWAIALECFFTSFVVPQGLRGGVGYCVGVRLFTPFGRLLAERGLAPLGRPRYLPATAVTAVPA